MALKVDILNPKNDIFAVGGAAAIAEHMRSRGGRTFAREFEWWKGRLKAQTRVILEFPSVQAFKDWQEAPEYQELKSKRFEAGQNKSSNYFGLYRATMTGRSAACSKFFKSQGLQERQQVVFLSHGGEDVSNLQFYRNPQAEHLLDWLHVTMRLTVLTQTAKGLQETVEEEEDQAAPRSEVLRTLESIKWYL
jgi:uncharacterized protein (DUF1330 family)